VARPAALQRRVGKARERLPGFVEELIERLRQAEVLFYGAGLAFYGLISLAPTLIVGFWIVGSIAGEARVSSLADNLVEMSPGDANVQPIIDNLLEVGPRVGVGALLAALWPATAYGSGLVRALDEISMRDDRSMQGLRGRLKSLSLLLGLPVFLLGALGASYLLTGVTGDGWLTRLLAWAAALVVGTLVTTVALTGIYMLFGPDPLSWRSFALAALVAATAIAALSLGYLVYLERGTDWEERVAGSGLAAVVLLGLWLYLANIILLAGYALALAHNERRPDLKGRSSDQTVRDTRQGRAEMQENQDSSLPEGPAGPARTGPAGSS
jgi:membrane protein